MTRSTPGTVLRAFCARVPVTLPTAPQGGVPALLPLLREVTWPRTHSYKQDPLRREGEKLLREHLLRGLELCFQEPSEWTSSAQGQKRKQILQKGEQGGWSHSDSVGGLGSRPGSAGSGPSRSPTSTQREDLKSQPPQIQATRLRVAGDLTPPVSVSVCARACALDSVPGTVT